MWAPMKPVAPVTRMVDSGSMDGIVMRLSVTDGIQLLPTEVVHSLQMPTSDCPAPAIPHGWAERYHYSRCTEEERLWEEGVESVI